MKRRKGKTTWKKREKSFQKEKIQEIEKYTKAENEWRNREREREEENEDRIILEDKDRERAG